MKGPLIKRDALQDVVADGGDAVVDVQVGPVDRPSVDVIKLFAAVIHECLEYSKLMFLFLSQAYY